MLSQICYQRIVISSISRLHLNAFRQVRGTVVHPKIHQVSKKIAELVENSREKVVVFCYHHAVALDLVEAIAERLPNYSARTPELASYQRAWTRILRKQFKSPDLQKYIQEFVRWLSQPNVAAQAGALLRVNRWPTVGADLARIISHIPDKTDMVRLRPRESLHSAMATLFEALTDPESASTRAMLGKGALPTNRVIAFADYDRGSVPGITVTGEPDTVVATFNSPLGPEVLVATDRLSEGLDLHRYCRHLVHFELPYSPIRVFQRNGRIRRLQSWAAVTNQQIVYHYPVLRGTRDERLAEIVSRRMGFVGQLLGGVGMEVFDQEEIGGDLVEKTRADMLSSVFQDVLSGLAKHSLTKLSIIR